MTRIRVERIGRGGRCPYCLSEVEPADASSTCARCQVLLHLECARILGRCPTVGCEARLSCGGLERWSGRLPSPPTAAGETPSALLGGTEDGIELSPSALLDGRPLGERSFLAYVPPEKASEQAYGCSIPTLAIAAFGVLSWNLFPLPTPLYVVGAFVVLIGLFQSSWATRSWMAAWRLHLRFRTFPRRARPGELIDISFQVRGRQRTRIQGLTLVLACIERERRLEGVHRTLRYHRVLDFGRTLEVVRGERQDFRVHVQLPDDALETRGNASGDNVRWVVGVVADVPNWPDYELARELKVVRGAQREPRG